MTCPHMSICVTLKSSKGPCHAELITNRFRRLNLTLKLRGRGL